MLKFKLYFFWFVNSVALVFILSALTKWKFDGIIFASMVFSFFFDSYTNHNHRC